MSLTAADLESRKYAQGQLWNWTMDFWHKLYERTRSKSEILKTQTM